MPIKETLYYFLIQDDFVSFEKAPEGLRTFRKWLDVKRIKGKNAYRLKQTPDAYKEIFLFINDAGDDIGILLGSVYSDNVVGEEFLIALLSRFGETPYYNNIRKKYGNEKTGEVVADLLADKPGLPALAIMFKTSPSVAEALLFPEQLSRYELTHMKPCLDLKFAADMLHRAPEKTDITVKYEVIVKGKINLEEKGGTGIP